MLSNFGAPKFDSVTSRTAIRRSAAHGARGSRCCATRCRRRACCAQRKATMRCCAPRARRHAARRNRLSALRAAGGAERSMRRVPPTAAAVYDDDRRLALRFPGGSPAAGVQVRRATGALRHIRPRTRRRRRGAASAAAGPHCRGAAGAARQRHRGFNHAQEIARVVSSLTGVPLLAGLRRIRDSPPQAGLARVARARNVRGASHARRGSTVSPWRSSMT